MQKAYHLKLSLEQYTALAIAAKVANTSMRQLLLNAADPIINQYLAEAQECMRQAGQAKPSVADEIEGLVGSFTKVKPRGRPARGMGIEPLRQDPLVHAEPDPWS